MKRTIIGLTMPLLLAGGGTMAADWTWPQWRGPHRDGVSRETGLLKEWPEAGPNVLWTATGLGRGYSSLAVTDRLICTAGTTNGQTFVLAIDLDGRPLWKTPNGKP